MIKGLVLWLGILAFNGLYYVQASDLSWEINEKVDDWLHLHQIDSKQIFFKRSGYIHQKSRISQKGTIQSDKKLCIVLFINTIDPALKFSLKKNNDEKVWQTKGDLLFVDLDTLEKGFYEMKVSTSAKEGSYYTFMILEKPVLTLQNVAMKI